VRALKVLGFVVLGCVALILSLAAIGHIAGPSPERLKREEERAASAAQAKAVAAQYVTLLTSMKLVKSEWGKSGGTVMMISFTVRNDNSDAVKDVGVACEVFGGSGTSLGIRKTVIFELFAPGKSRTVRDQNMGVVNPQAQTARCEVVSFAWADGRPLPF
jgi:hypothetical protein